MLKIKEWIYIASVHLILKLVTSWESLKKFIQRIYKKKNDLRVTKEPKRA